MKNPFLVGTSFYLRPLEKEDLDGGYVQWLNDPEVCAYNSHGIFPYTKEQAFEYINQAYASRENLIFAIVDKESDIHIGNVALQKIDFFNQNAEFAILIGEKAFWGKGCGKEAGELVLRHGFRALNLARIYCGTSSENKGMQRLALSLGMAQEGIRRFAMYKNGQFVDIVEYGILKPEFFAKFL